MRETTGTESVFDMVDHQRKTLMAPLSNNPAAAASRQIGAFTEHQGELAQLGAILRRAATRNADRIAESHNDRLQASLHRVRDIADRLSGDGREPGAMIEAWREYLEDAGQRFVLTLDALRQRGDQYLAHEAAGCPPVLVYDTETVLDGADLPRPCNYFLLRILPPEGVEVLDWKRPYVIIDPRAGHGAGIGGFKTDSQVGVALKDGHPVYFVAFRRDPVPGQTLADVTRAEGEFVREVVRRHPDSPQPVVVGNCQGGWATLLLAATNRDVTGPIVLNGAPVAPWSGRVGQDPMRYNGGVLGGTWLPMLFSDLGGGVFDGAHLVQNFELLNPSRNFFRKYYDLYADIDRGVGRFLEFEQWWGGHFLMNEAEIRWIVENLFVGNKLVRNEAHLEPGRAVDVKKISSPIIVFASWGDNITPPQQALNWIVDSYGDVTEIQIRGQRIVYMIHDQVGHLGIFVSSKIATKEHAEVASTMKTIESLAPGLYEMKIEDFVGEGVHRSFTVSFHKRTLDDIRALDDGRDDEAPFAAVARASEMQAEAYDVGLRPMVKAMVNPILAEQSRALHPARAQRALFSSRNPMVKPLQQMAEQAKAERRPVAADNPFMQVERVWADLVEQSLDMARDMRDMWYELTFFALWGNPAAREFGQSRQLGRTLKHEEELRALPEVQSALKHICAGGVPEAIVRMLILLAGSRGNVRRDRLERSARVLTQDEPFRSLSAQDRKMIIHEQTLIVEFEPERAIETLPELLKSKADRKRAAEAVQYVSGPISEMAPHTLSMLQRVHKQLGLPQVTEDVLDDPLADAASAQADSDGAKPVDLGEKRAG